MKTDVRAALARLSESVTYAHAMRGVGASDREPWQGTADEERSAVRNRLAEVALAWGDELEQLAALQALVHRYIDGLESNAPDAGALARDLEALVERLQESHGSGGSRAGRQRLQ
jgi:hypothetical protein